MKKKKWPVVCVCVCVCVCVDSYPSRMDSLQQYRLSNFCLVTESLTFMAGTHSLPALDNWYNLHTHTHTHTHKYTHAHTVRHADFLISNMTNYAIKYIFTCVALSTIHFTDAPRSAQHNTNLNPSRNSYTTILQFPCLATRWQHDHVSSWRETGRGQTAV